MDMTYNVLVSILGLICDISGSLFLILGIAVKSFESIKEEGATKWGENPDLVISNIKTKSSNISGLMLLVIGFIMQICGYISSHDIASLLFLILMVFFVVVLIVFAVLFYLVNSKKYAKEYVRQFIDSPDHNPNGILHDSVSNAFAKALNVKFPTTFLQYDKKMLLKFTVGIITKSEYEEYSNRGNKNPGINA